MPTFKIVTEPFLNCDKIHPTHQNYVKQLIDYLSQNDNVQYIKIFGPSLTRQCNFETEVAFYVQLERNEKVINKYLPIVYDYWNNYNIEQILMDEVDREGVLVYEKKNNT